MDPKAIMLPELNAASNIRADIRAAFNTTQLWSRIVKKRGIEWMFPSIFPLLLKYLSKSDILEARLVSKTWKKVIDSYLENDQPTIIAPGGQHLFIHHFPIRTWAVCFGENARRLGLPSPLDALLRFQSEFDTEQVSTNNPFVSRSMHIEITQMNLAVDEFLKKFGLHLFSLQLSICQRTPQEITSQVEIAAFIFMILCHLPNVRKLDLKVTQNFEKRQDRLTVDTERNRLGEFFAQTYDDIPDLPHLKSLQWDLNPLIGLRLEIAYAPQLETYAHVMFDKKFPSNLNHMTKKPLAWHFAGDCPIEHLDGLNNSQRQSLKRLHIDVKSVQPREWHYRLFETVEKFKWSLTHLSLSWETFEPIFPEQLGLPFLQKLYLEIGCWYQPENFNLCFLRKLKSLRKLKCAFWNHGVGYEGLLNFYKNSEKPKHQPMQEAVDLHYHLYDDSHGGPYKSNVWKLVPFLDRIEIQFIKYPPVGNNTLYKFYTRSQMGK